MPEEIAAIIIVSIIATFGAVIAVTKIIVNHLDRRRGTPATSSLTQGELRELIVSAVAEATAPIEDELSRLQGQLDPPETPARLPQPNETDPETH